MNNYLYKKVMIVDDSKLDRFISAAVIENNSFAEEVFEFSSVATAISYLLSLIHTPDSFPQIIFLDINMPVMDGFDFVDNYMRLPANIQERCAIVMISSSNCADDFRRIKTYPSVRLFFNKPLTGNILKDIHSYMGDEIFFFKMKSATAVLQ